MKNILFDKGKLYVVELPQLMDFEYHGRHLKFKEAHAAALANKVEVKNPELISFRSKFGDWYTIHPYLEKKGQVLKEGNTFPLPDGIKVIKNTCEDLCACTGFCKTVTLKRIEPEKSIARRIYDETPQEVKDKVRAYGNEVVKKSVEPALPEGLHNGMTAQQVYEWLDKRCMFEPHQKDYVLLIIKLIINAKLST